MHAHRAVRGEAITYWHMLGIKSPLLVKNEI
jgi:hypothetical protein